MAIVHHPRDEFLLSYAVGGLAYPTQIVIATHLSLCGCCREVVRLLDAIGGAMLESLAGAPLAIDALPGALTQLNDVDSTAERLSPIVEDMETARILPAPLRALVGKPFRALTWHALTPDVRITRLGSTAEGKVRAVMTLSRAGSAFASHDHAAVEFSLPLVGGWSDEHGHFVRGDLSVREPGETHSAVMDEGEDCLTFTVVDETLVPCD